MRLTGLRLTRRSGRAPGFQRWNPGIAIAGAVVILVLYVLLLGRGASWLDGSNLGGLTPEQRTAEVDTMRGYLIQAGAGILAFGALVYTSLNFRLSREGHVTDRYTRAIEQLGSGQLDVRVGAVYALERIMIDSGRDHPTIVEVLAAFIREHSPASAKGLSQIAIDSARRRRTFSDVWIAYARERARATSATVGRPTPKEPRVSLLRTGTEHPATDVQAALTVLGRRPSGRVEQGRINLQGTKLTGANLEDASLADADLSFADLSGAHLARANLSRADLSCADLSNADMWHVDLFGADLSYADLTLAQAVGAGFTEADMRHVDLSDADLQNADLRRADLTRARLLKANVTDATFSRARLRRANFSDAKLARTIITDADLSGVQLSTAQRANAIELQTRNLG